jgi:DNA-binding MarR family transcriptional regulator
MNNMKNNREQLLHKLLESFSKVAHSMHSDKCLPLGSGSLTKQQFTILFFIFENNGSASVKELASFLKVTPGAITQFVDRLVDNKLVLRTESKLDRRVTNIELTESMKKQFMAIKKSYLISAGKVFSSLSDSELSQLVKLLQKIDNPLKKTPL